jgi:hypothetical protein
MGWLARQAMVVSLIFFILFFQPNSRSGFFLITFHFLSGLQFEQ